MFNIHVALGCIMHHIVIGQPDSQDWIQLAPDCASLKQLWLGLVRACESRGNDLSVAEVAISARPGLEIAPWRAP